MVPPVDGNPPVEGAVPPVVPPVVFTIPPVALTIPPVAAGTPPVDVPPVDRAPPVEFPPEVAAVPPVPGDGEGASALQPKWLHSTVTANQEAFRAETEWVAERAFMGCCSATSFQKASSE
jgi:hypothetical protein